MNVHITIPSKRSRRPSSRTLLSVVVALLWAAILILPVSADRKTDYIVLLDVSKGMFDSFEKSVDMLVEEVLKKQLSADDTFHLISFSDTPEFEVQRTLTDETAVKEALSRLLLLQPLGEKCDLVSALKYGTEYVDELSLNTRKRILLMTQGEHAPPEDSPYNDREDNLERMDTLASFIKRNGWELNIVRFPGGKKSEGVDEQSPEGGDSEQESLLQRFADELKVPMVRPGEDKLSVALAATGAVEVLYPSETLRGGREIEVDLGFRNHSHETRSLKVSSIKIDGEEVLGESFSVALPPDENVQKKVALRIPEKYGEGSHTVELELKAEQGGPIYPRKGKLHFELSAEDAGGLFEGGGVRYIVFALIFVLLLMPLFFLVRRLVSSPESEEKVPKRGATAAKTPDVSLGGKHTPAAEKTPGVSVRDKHTPAAKVEDKAHVPSAEERAETKGTTDVELKPESNKGRTSSEVESKTEEPVVGTSYEVESKTEEHAGHTSEVELKADASAGGGTSDVELRADTSAAGGTSDIELRKQVRETEDHASALASFKKNAGRESTQEASSRLASHKKELVEKGAEKKLTSSEFTGEELRKRKEAGEKPIEMRVDFQHPTPRRNLSWFKEGEERSIGGPGSGADYIITTIPVEGIIATVKRSGDRFELNTRNESYVPEHFRYEGKNILKERIKVRAPETERITNFSIREWTPTKERLNRYLHMIDEPGAPKEDLDPGGF